MAEIPILMLRGLSKSFRVPGNLFERRQFPAVQDVTLTVREGETFGIVGESGCGKTTVARLIMGLEKPTAGEIWFKGRPINELQEHHLRPLRPRFQMVFQDSGSSLNPRKRVMDILAEPMLYHKVVSRSQVEERVDTLLRQVGLPEELKGRYPHEFSGGQRQRICIARALSLNPDLIVLDEPVSALDVSVQAQILNLLKDLQEELGLTYIFIGHGLGAVRYVSHRMAVMYMGRVVETGEADTIFNHPAHPYTRALLDAAPVADYALRNRPRMTLSGEVGQEAPQSGCVFRVRCPFATDTCASADTALHDLSGGHWSACPMEIGLSAVDKGGDA